jgi:hypothetical protein
MRCWPQEVRRLRDPAFTETMQIGIVVRDLDATMRKFVDDYGIGPHRSRWFNTGLTTQGDAPEPSFASGRQFRRLGGLRRPAGNASAAWVQECAALARKVCLVARKCAK